VLGADGTLATEASLLHLGDTAIFFMPGEVLPRLGLAYKEQMYAAGVHHRDPGWSGQRRTRLHSARR
jgi:predicted glycosyltransferase